MDHENRVVVLIDMDCFYCQVEEKLDPELKGKPIAVVQYNPWKGGGIIAVNYVARAMGVTRHMRGDEAKEKCPEIQLPSVPCQRGKADISKYREAGKEVARVLQRFTPLLERASIDEAYLDITAAVETRLKTLNIPSITPSSLPNTFALGYDTIDSFVSDVQSNGSIDCVEFDTCHAARLLVGAVIVSEIRATVYQETGYTCSAGVAHNKILAKLVCGMNKPNKQTVLPKHCVDLLYKTLPLKKVKHLGGKFGDAVCEQLKTTLMGDLQRFTEKHLQNTFDEKNGTWLYNIARGVDSEPVQARFNPKSIGCCKQFRGKSALLDLETLRKWLQDLGSEIDDRLENDALENNRTPKQMVVSFATQIGGRDVSSSRSYNFTPGDELGAEMFSAKALELLLDSVEGVKYKEGESNRKLKAPIKFLGISVGKFEDNDMKKTKKIVDYFAAGPANGANANQIKNKENHPELETQTKNKSKNSDGKDYIMKKFFQVTDKTNNKYNNKSKEENTKCDKKGHEHDKINENECKTIVDTNNSVALNADLDKQESFFAKLLKKDEKSISRPNSALSSESLENIRPMTPNSDVIGLENMTPNCDVIAHGENSNDTEYSGSTINLEIDKSIALFEDDPNEVARVSSMRELINKSAMIASENSDESILERSSDVSVTLNIPKSKDPETNGSEENVTKNDVTEETRNIEKVVNDSEIIRNPSVDHFECPECRKVVSMKKVDEHADYHLALKLREEERQHVRQESKERLSKLSKKDDTKIKGEPRKKKDEQKNDSTGSISSFLFKIDEKTPTETCKECRKKVPMDKYAEHLDFHEAQKLNREINKRPAPSYFAGSGVKKRKTVSPVKKTKINSSKSIDSFFK